MSLFDDKEIKVGNTIKIISRQTMLMKPVKWVIGAFIIFIILKILVFNFLFIRIPAGYVGVRTNNLGILGKKGVVPEDFKHGYHRNFAVLDAWKIFDSTTQTLELSRKQ